MRVPWSGLVTALQISQMFVGMGICAALFVFKSQQGLPCDVTTANYWAGLLLYGSYAALFVKFAVERYVLGGGRGGGGDGEGGGARRARKLEPAADKEAKRVD